MDTLRHIIPSEHLWPIRDDDEHWRWHKAANAYGTDRWLSRWNYLEVFGELDDLEAEVRVSQFAKMSRSRIVRSFVRSVQFPLPVAENRIMECTHCMVLS